MSSPKGLLPKGLMATRVRGLRDRELPGEVKVIDKYGRVSYEPGTEFNPSFTTRHSYKSNKVFV